VTHICKSQSLLNTWQNLVTSDLGEKAEKKEKTTVAKTNIMAVG